MASRNAAVIGAGLAGLSCALRLAHAGWRVDLYDQRRRPGGKAYQMAADGFRFDTGPSLFTMPQVFGQLFDEVGERMADHLRLVPLAPLCTYFFADGTRLESSDDARRFGAEIEGATGDTSESLERYLRHCKRIYDVAADLFLWKSLREPSTYLSGSVLRALPRLWRLDALRTMDEANRSFFRDPRVVQLFNRYATYNGSSPFRVPATLAIIPHVEYGFGGYAVQGGIYAIPSALARLAAARGVRFFQGTRVSGVSRESDGRGGGAHIRGAGRRGCGRRERGRVRGIVVDGEARPYDVVVSNADLLRTYEDLLDEREDRWPRRYRRLEPSSSGLVFLWGMRGGFPELGVHNIIFSADYRREFDDIFSSKTCPEEPTVYVNITSRVDAEDAPAGCENWFVLVNAPALAGQDWAGEVARTRSAVLRRLEGVMGRPVARAVVLERVLTPEDIERDTGSSGGSLYGISSNTRLAAFLRHPNRVRRIPGLYFCGGSVHPGGGMPLAVLSGKIASDLVRRYEE